MKTFVLSSLVFMLEYDAFVRMNHHAIGMFVYPYMYTAPLITSESEASICPSVCLGWACTVITLVQI